MKTKELKEFYQEFWERCLIEDLKSFGLNVEEETKFAKKGKSKENKQFFREALKDAAVICKTNKKVKNH